MDLTRVTSWMEKLSLFIHKWRANFEKLWGSGHIHVWLTSAEILGGLSLLTFALYEHAKRVDLRDRMQIFRAMVSECRVRGQLEDNLKLALNSASLIVRAPYYAFYTWDARAERYILRAASHPYDLFEGVGPAYSGLALPKKDAYLPPSVLSDPSLQETVTLRQDEGAQTVFVRIGKRLGLVQIGPVRVITRRERRYLHEFSSLLEGLVEDWIKLEDDRVLSELHALSEIAINRVASVASNTLSIIPLLLQTSSGFSSQLGAIFLVRDLRGDIRLFSNEKWTPWARELEREPGALERLMAAGREAERIFTRSDPAFYDLPVSITAHDKVGAIANVACGERGTLYVLYDTTFDPDHWFAAGRLPLLLLADGIRQTVEQFDDQQHMAHNFSRLLYQIAKIVDNLSPYTVGYSDMLARYSLAIGKELGLAKDEMQDLAMAARLSNIGIVGMDVGLLTKEGAFSDFEYSVMKRHSEIGATMIELVTGNTRAAKYVLHHHERVDGYGYPAGLQGAEIPVGARILHVVQFFLAKVSGRAWRTPLSFDVAISMLRGSSGTALDPDVVQAFQNWLEKKGGRPQASGRNLGACYDMCCVPEVICDTCSARANPYRCWESPDNHCRLHGRECDTCFVKSEFATRSTRTQRA